MKKTDEIKLIENTISEYNNRIAMLDKTIVTIMKEIGKLDFTEEVRDDYINSYVIEVPTYAGDFPLTAIEYQDDENVVAGVYIKYYMGEITNKEAFDNEKCYGEDALVNYKEDDFKMAILEKIKDCLKKKKK